MLQKKSGVVGETSWEEELEEVNVIEITHLPVERDGSRPVNGEGFAASSDFDLRNTSPIEEPPGRSGGGEIENGGEVERNTGGGREFKSSFFKSRVGFPTNQRNPDPGIGMALPDSFKRDLRGGDESIEVFKFQSGSQGVGPVENGPHFCGLAFPVPHSTAKLVEEFGNRPVILGAGLRRRFTAQLLPSQASFTDES